MRRNIFLAAIILLTGIFNINLSAQTNTDIGIKPNFAGGEVTSVSDGKIVLQTKDGAIELVLSDKTEYKRVPPETPVLKAAVASNLSEICVGDKLLVTGLVAADKKTIPAKAIYLITKADISQKQTKEQDEWRTRGIAGRVTAFNPQTNVLTVSVRGFAGEKIVLVTPNKNAQFYRYAPDSVKFSEAKKSVVSDIEIGDAIRAVGDKNADGSTITAEKIISGAFKTVGGTITAINTEKNEITITDFQTKKPVTIIVSDASVLKQFPAEMAQKMAQFQGGGGQGSFRPPTQGNGQTPQQTPPTQGQTTPNVMGQGGMRGGGIDEMIERFPTVKITDLKVGEMIAVSSTKSADPSRIKAIKLLSGVEPFIKMQQAVGGGQGNGARGGNSGFTIPGLDGFGAP
jgi:hypothetical protein